MQFLKNNFKLKFKLNFKIIKTKLKFSTKSKYESLSIEFDTGNLNLNSGKLARLSDSSATGNINDTHVLTTIVSRKTPSRSTFLPLIVDYFHKASASGKIPTTFTRRDYGVSNLEILVSRIIDRSIRPLFLPSFNNDTQIICNLLSFDGEQNPDVVCVNTVSYALYGSNLPWFGPVGCVRVGIVDSKFVTNPTRKQLEKSPLNLLVTTNSNSDIVMLEGWADNLDQNKFIDALEYGVNESNRIVKIIKDTKRSDQIKQLKDFNSNVKLVKNDYYERIKKLSVDVMTEIYRNLNHDKKSRDDAIAGVRNEVINQLITELKETNDSYVAQQLNEYFTQIVKDTFRGLTLTEPKRCDGRDANELRQISGSVNLFKKLHGSALFQRGQTQVLCTVTLDSPDSMYKNTNIIDVMTSPTFNKSDKNFMLHYEFPPYATNEIGRMSGPADRREIGHGALAEKAIYSILPDSFPYTIRLLCEVLESNGSSSMASVCASSMALLDAGIEINEPVCGVAMGLITKMDENQSILNYKILTDLMGFEDFIGDMDFKIAGTRNGITAVQADIKIIGLPLKIAIEALEKSKDARIKIIEKMNAVISEKRSVDKKMPTIKEMDIPINKRSRFVGVGGINLQKIQSNTGVRITPINETKFSIFAPNSVALNEAEKMISAIMDKMKEPELEFGAIYTAKVIEVIEAGVMVQLYPTMKPTLLPNSQLDTRRIEHGSSSGLSVGQEIQIKYFGRDPVTGSMRLSRKVLFLSTPKPKKLFDKENSN